MRSYIIIFTLVLFTASTSFCNEDEFLTVDELLSISGAQRAKGEKSSLEKKLELVADRMNHTLERIDDMGKEREKAADEVQRAERGLAESDGFIMTTIARDKLANARKEHHELSRKIKQSKRRISAFAQLIADRVASADRRLEQEALRLEEKLSGDENSDKTADKIKAINDIKEQLHSSIEHYLGDFSPLIQNGFEPGAPEGEQAPPPPPKEWYGQDGRADGKRGQGGRRQMGPPEGRGEFMRPSWKLLQYHRQRMAEMEQEIEQLRQEVHNLSKRLESLEARNNQMENRQKNRRNKGKDE